MNQEVKELETFDTYLAIWTIFIAAVLLVLIIYLLFFFKKKDK